jgi:hypothetical protein
VVTGATDTPLSPIVATPMPGGDIPATSVFSGAKQPTIALQGTTVDWSANYASVAAGSVPVLEFQGGLEWKPGMAAPIIGGLTAAAVGATCPAWASVQLLSTTTDALVRSLGSSAGMTPRELGTAIHVAIATQVAGWGGGFKAELYVPLFFATGTILGSLRLDILERTAANAICVYDIKTGDTPMSHAQIQKYYEAAYRWATTLPGGSAFVPTAVYVIPVYTKVM